MKLIYIILLLLSNAVQATRYYVANAGSDANNGTNTATPWQTISKLNSSAFLPDDSIFFKRGDFWNETFRLPSSGTSGHVIYHGAYGTGTNPLITGFQSITLINQGGNIWAATASNSVAKLNTVLINGQLGIKARFPNYGYSTFTSYVSDSRIIDLALTGTPNYAGAEVATHHTQWIIDVAKISSQSGDTLTLYPALTAHGGGKEYFLQNAVSLLDTAGEYSYDSVTKVLSVYATSSPTVKYSNIDTLINIKQKSYLTFDSINFTGSNIFGLKIDSARTINITHCTVSDHGMFGVYGLYLNGLNVTNDSIQNCLSNGSFTDADTSVNYQNNIVRRIGKYAGMGGNGNGRYIGLYNQGHLPNYTNNKLTDIGYIPIYWKGKNGLLEHNFIDSFGNVKLDGGGIYTYQSGLAYNFDSGTVVKNNIVDHGLGLTETYGLYLDIATYGVKYDSNTAVNCSAQMILVNGSHNIFRNNTLFSVNGKGCFYSLEYYNGTSLFMTVKKNIFYSAGTSNNYNTVAFTGNRDTTESIDSNYYLMPSFPGGTFNNGGLFGDHYSLAQWQAYIPSYDAHSSSSLPVNYTSPTPVLIYNPTLADSTITLSGNYADVFGTIYRSYALVHPFQSKLLFPVTVRGIKSIGNLNFE